MKSYPIPVAISLQVIPLERKTLDWLIHSNVLMDQNLLLQIEQQKFSWFAAYLFPEMDFLRLEKVMRFFDCLFLLDDLLDRNKANVFMEALENLKDLKSLGYEVYIESNTQEKITSLFDHLGRLARHISSFGNEIWKRDFQEIWKDYLDAQIWEINNKFKKELPMLSEYQEKRLFSSGVFLALHLLKIDWPDQNCAVYWLERKAARIICLSNDIKSADKEKRAGDFHNELLLLQAQTGCSEPAVRDFTEKQVQGLFGQLFELMDLCEKQEEGLPKNWIEELLLLIGGCMYWSEEDTVRYAGSINGMEKY
ncbi:hypothetical protein JYB64_06145 [Algoriphagus aestuarii]|nr:hypothetical protein [Algoriphagus aestuarii]